MLDVSFKGFTASERGTEWKTHVEGVQNSLNVYHAEREKRSFLRDGNRVTFPMIQICLVYTAHLII